MRPFLVLLGGSYWRGVTSSFSPTPLKSIEGALRRPFGNLGIQVLQLEWRRGWRVTQNREDRSWQVLARVGHLVGGPDCDHWQAGRLGHVGMKESFWTQSGGKYFLKVPCPKGFLPRMRKPNQKFAGGVSPDGEAWRGWYKGPAALKQLQTKVLTERLSREPRNLPKKEKSLLWTPTRPREHQGRITTAGPNECFPASQASSFSCSHCLSLQPREWEGNS